MVHPLLVTEQINSCSVTNSFETINQWYKFGRKNVTFFLNYLYLMYLDICPIFIAVVTLDFSHTVKYVVVFWFSDPAVVTSAKRSNSCIMCLLTPLTGTHPWFNVLSDIITRCEHGPLVHDISHQL